MTRLVTGFLVLGLLGISATAAPDGFAGSDSAPEYEVKAAYLFNLANFTDWPPAMWTSPSVPFKICVAAPDPFHGQLTKTFQGEHISGHPAVVRQVHTPSELDGCQMLFVGDGADPTGALLKSVADAPILTVGEDAAFEKRGGIITFVLESGRVRFRVNPAAAERAHLHLSSKVLQVAATRDRTP